jgi:hypothetical protein
MVQSSAETSPDLNFLGELISKKYLDCSMGESLLLGLLRKTYFGKFSQNF